MTEQTEQQCFVIMPIADQDGYGIGHFRHVYKNIIVPSCKKAGYKAFRADDVVQTNFIHLDILRRLVEAPIAVCDLSSRNPNVLFELGIRQAFDMPVVLIQEKGTPKIFDITPLRYVEYSREMQYHDVLETHEKLSEAITATVVSAAESGNVNSIVRLLSLQAATIPKLEENNASFAFDVLQAEMRAIRESIASLRNQRASDLNPDESKFLSYLKLFNSQLASILTTPMTNQRRVASLNNLLLEVDLFRESCVIRHQRESLSSFIERIESELSTDKPNALVQ